MIKFYIGKPRSGKTYALVQDIYDNFMNPKSKDYKKHQYLYTNINGFKIDEVNKMLDNNLFEFEKDESFSKKIYALKWDSLYKHLVEIEKIGDNDDKLIKYCKAHKLYNARFDIDECHKYLFKEDKVLVWWLGYHGHMGQDISFVTQNLKKVHFKYKLDSEMFLEAQPKSKALTHRQLRYKEYASDSFTDEQLTRKFSVMMKDKIHALYNSGDIHKPKSVTLPLLGALLAFIIIGFALFYLLFSQIAPDDDSINNVLENQNVTTIDKPVLSENTSVLFVRCSSSNCWNTDPKYTESSYDYAYVRDIMKVYAELLTELDRHTYKITHGNAIFNKPKIIQSYVTYAFQIDTTTAHKLFPFFFIKVKQKKESFSAFNNGSSKSFSTEPMPEGLGDGV